MEQTLNLQTLKALFQRSDDVMFQRYIMQQHTVHVIYCDAMINELLLQTVIVRELQKLMFENTSDELLEEDILKSLHVPHLKKVSEKEEAITKLYKGHVLLYFEDEQLLFTSYIPKKPNREPRETALELVIKGPRDDFIEDIDINIALLRKRLPTNSLGVERYEIGRRSKTSVAILYMEDIVNKKILEEIKVNLQKVDADIVVSGDILMERIEQSAKILPRHDYTGRPDFAVQALINGRIVIMVDGVTYAILTPANMLLLFKSGEDYYFPIIVSSMERLLRIVGILISVLLPGFWLALTTYHQNQLPLILLATVVQSRTGLPFPTILEILLMVFMFEMFREANMRLPSIISGSISVVGGLIIGDAAIKAGITSPPMIVVIAISSIAAYTLVNQSFVTAMSIFRIIIILAAAFFGLYGFFIAIFFILLFTSNLRVFGIPYLNLGADLNWQDMKKSLVRLSPKGYGKRPEFLNLQDKTRTSHKRKK